ncbi:hypothetical protein PF003_g35777 [Phytophthora fragariae]|nr:hypothetical protein PF003_g35777 [Phytophthora fragariae]
MGTIGSKLMDWTSVTLSDVLYTPEVEGSVILVAKLGREGRRRAVQQGQSVVFRYGDATVIEA